MCSTDIARADHISYKCGSHTSFEKMRRLLEQEDVGEYLHQPFVAGRPIAYVCLCSSLCNALRIPFGMVSFVELADQKPDGSQRDGFDHIEIYPRPSSSFETVTYQQLVSETLGIFPSLKMIKRPHHTTWDVTLESGAILRLTEESLIEKIKREMD